MALFFAEVEKGDVNAVLKQMHPQLQKQIDPPVLEAWLQAVSYRLGSVDKIVPVNKTPQSNPQEQKANIQFLKGEAEATVRVRGDAIVAFEVKSEKLKNWFQRPTSMNFYQQQGQQFLSELQAQKFEACKNLLHQKISEQISENDLKKYAEKIILKTGKLENRSFRYSKLTILPDERLQQIDLFYEIKGDRGTVYAELAIRFQGMKGYIIGFEFYDTLKK